MWDQAIVTWRSLGIAGAIARCFRGRPDEKELTSVLWNALQVRGNKPVLPIATRIYASVIGQCESSNVIGAPAMSGDAGLTDTLAKLVLDLCSRNDLTDELVEQKRRILRSAPVREEEIEAILKDIPVLKWCGEPEAKHKAERQKLIAVLRDSRLVRREICFAGSSLYGIRFDVESFLFDSVRADMKHYMWQEAQARFSGCRPDVFVSIHRGSADPNMNGWLANLAGRFQATRCVMPVSELESDILRAKTQSLEGKRAVLVEPLLLDDGCLERVFAFLGDCGVTVCGTLVVFQDVGFDPACLLHKDRLLPTGMGKGLTGQVLLDLRKI